jgi:alpha-tubulin suppressor-like RCC1 family protein
LAAQDVIGLESPVAAVACGYDHTCAIAGSSRTLFCWGRNDEGQLGEGSTTDAATPKSVKSGLSNLAISGATLIAAGERHSCAVIGTSGLYCWGYNKLGSVGNGANIDVKVPTEVVGLGPVSLFALGGATTCAGNSSAVYCWGWNAAGQVGDGTFTSPILTPFDTMGPSSEIIVYAVGSVR